LEVVVSDSGVGIAAEFLPQVFDRFSQSDSSTTRSRGGLGLGLSIVKQLVELHGGSVRAASDGANRGASFTISLPLAALRREPPPESPRAEAEELGPAVADVSLRGVRVLVVDDEPDARELIGVLLQECHAEVTTAASASEALAMLQRLRPDLLVSDVGMPGRDGYQLIQDIRQLRPEHGGMTPAIALTAFARSEDRTRAMLAGYQVHMAKPVEARELVATVASLAKRSIRG
jgi:CheY-like chemotaxis protein